jgi:hypothetical protein
MVDLKKKLLELYKKHYSYYSSYSSSHIHKVDSIKYVIGDKSLSDKIFNFLMLLFVFLKKLLDIVMVIQEKLDYVIILSYMIFFLMLIFGFNFGNLYTKVRNHLFHKKGNELVLFGYR